ncbi:MAG TPA: hypothetical protein VIM62_08755, partial [Acidobacteriaceae bacterium]
MHKMLLALAFALCFIVQAVPQSARALLNLKELDESYAIAKGGTKLSVEETKLIKQLTRHITS